MALVNCPDCGHRVSDCAAACIGCGRPMVSDYELRDVKINMATQEATLARKSKGIVAIKIGFVSIIATIIASFGLGRLPDSTAYYSGEILGAALVPWGIAMFALIRSERAAWITWGVVFTLSWLGQWNLERENWSANQAASPELKSEVHALADLGREQIRQQQKHLDSITSTDSLPQDAAGRDKHRVAITRKDDPVLVVRRLTSVLREMLQEGNAKQAELANKMTLLQLDSVLQPASLTTASGIAKSEEILRAYSALLDESEMASINYNNEVEKRVSAVVRGWKSESIFISNFRSAAAKRIGLEKELLANQRELVDAGMKVVSFMGVRLGTTSVENGQIMFPGQAEADAYNSLIADVQRLAEEESKLTVRYQSHLNDVMASMDKLSAESEAN